MKHLKTLGELLRLVLYLGLTAAFFMLIEKYLK